MASLSFVYLSPYKRAIFKKGFIYLRETARVSEYMQMGRGAEGENIQADSLLITESDAGLYLRTLRS